MANLKNNQKHTKRELLKEAVITEYKSSFKIYQEHWEAALPTRKQFAETYNRLALMHELPLYKQQDTKTSPSYPSFCNALNNYADEQERIFQIDISRKRTERMILFHEDIIFLITLKNNLFTQEDLICFISPDVTILNFEYNNLFSLLIHCDEKLFTENILDFIKSKELADLEITHGKLDLLISFKEPSSRKSYLNLLQYQEYDKSYFIEKLDYNNPLVYESLSELIKNYETIHPSSSLIKY